MKVVIAGSRDFCDYEFLVGSIEKLLESNEIVVTEIVSGGARGADILGEKFAEEFSIPVKLFPAEWDKFGKSAGYVRNSDMAGYGDCLVAFWDGYSRGTKHMIQTMKNQKKPCFVFEYRL